MIKCVNSVHEFLSGRFPLYFDVVSVACIPETHRVCGTTSVLVEGKLNKNTGTRYFNFVLLLNIHWQTCSGRFLSSP